MAEPPATIWPRWPHKFDPAYRPWITMRQRCQNPKATGYANYGGRGISVHPSWENFLQFFKDVGRRPSFAHSLHRLDNDGNYEPGNVVWATQTEQMTNTSRTVYVVYDGERQPLMQVAAKLGIKRKTMTERYRMFGNNPEKLFMPHRGIQK